MEDSSSSMEETQPTPKKLKPNKKRSNIDTQQVVSIKDSKDNSYPIAGYYSSGFNPIDTKKKPPNVLAFRNERKVKRVELVVKPDSNSISNKVEYVGTNYSGESAAGKIGSHCVAIFDKQARKLTFVPLTSYRVFRLEPKVIGSGKSEMEPETPAKSELTAEERMKKINNLTNVYGTKSAIKTARRNERLKGKEDPGFHDELNQILEEAPIDQAAVNTTSTNFNRNIPLHDVSATTPETAYPVERIIHKGEWHYLEDIFDRLQAGKELKPAFYPSFVANRIYKVDLLKDEAEKRNVAGILSYITHLVNFKNKHMIKGSDSGKHFKIPNMLYQKFTTMFLDTDNNKLSDEKTGSLVSHVLVLTLHIDEFQTDYSDIAKDLKMTASALRPHFENLGCKFRRRHNVSVATLPVPLEFPTLKRKRRG